jgi:hypothetical protein
MAINTSPEPFSNWAASFGEDLLVGVLIYLALVHPLALLFVLAALLALTVWLLPKLWSFLRDFGARIARAFGRPTGSAPPATTPPRQASDV